MIELVNIDMRTCGKTVNISPNQKSVELHNVKPSGAVARIDLAANNRLSILL